jgi:hypothetical protein
MKDRLEPEAAIGECCSEAVVRRDKFSIPVIRSEKPSVALDCSSAANPAFWGRLLPPTEN